MSRRIGANALKRKGDDIESFRARPSGHKGTVPFSLGLHKAKVSSLRDGVLNGVCLWDVCRHGILPCFGFTDEAILP